jgi:hypothetical protein
MKSRQGYKGYVIVARSCELQDGGFAAEFSVEEHDASGYSAGLIVSSTFLLKPSDRAQTLLGTSGSASRAIYSPDDSPLG